MSATRLPVQGRPLARPARPAAPVVPPVRPQPTSRASTGAAATTSSLSNAAAAVAGPSFVIDPPGNRYVTSPTTMLAPHEVNKRGNVGSRQKRERGAEGERERKKKGGMGVTFQPPLANLSRRAPPPTHTHTHSPPDLPPSPLLSSQILDALIAAVHPDDADRYKALYSSDLGGIITEPALMVVAADDHAVHRGHAVFESVALVEGRLYMLDAHLDRLFRSAASAGLVLPFNRPQVRRVVLETAAAGGAMHASVRVWLGAGRGGYGLSPGECRRPSLHVAVYLPRAPPPGGVDAAGDPTGISVCTATGVQPPDAWAAGIKSTNYLRNALAQAEAEAGGFDLGVFADPATGIVTEAANASLGIITHEGELVIPPWDRALPGVTAQRVVDMLPQVRKWREIIWEKKTRARTHPFLFFFISFFLSAGDVHTRPQTRTRPPDCVPLFSCLPDGGTMSQTTNVSNLQITIFRMRFGRTSNTRP